MKHSHAHKEGKISKGASLSKIKWDEKKHKRAAGGRFTFKPGTEEFKAEPFGAPKTSGVTNADVIKLHVKANPKKAGSTAANDFAQYKDNMTVGEFKAAVGPNAQGHLTHDTKKGFITIHDPKTLPPVEKELAFSDYVITSKTTGVKPTDKIKLLATDNPKKPGSKAAEDFAKYKDEMTVGEFHTAVGDKSAGQGHILHDMKKGYISVHDPVDLKALKTDAKSPGQVAAEMKVVEKKLGVETTNPFSPGTKNHQDFEDTAKKFGLQTPVPKQPEVTIIKQGESVVPKPATPTPAPTPAPKPGGPAHGLSDDDVIESYLGNKYTVASYKMLYKNQPMDIDSMIAQKLKNGDLKLVSKAAAAPAPAATSKTPILSGLSDNDMILTHTGSEIPASDFKHMIKSGGSLAYVADVESKLSSGQWKVVGKTVATPKTPKVADIPAQDHANYDVMHTTASNPYEHGTPKWIKFQAIGLNATKTMSLQKYYTTKALTPTEKTTTLQQMIDEGHVKLVTPDQKAVVAAQKAKFAAEQFAKQQEKNAAAAQAAKDKYKLHFEQVKPADWHNDPKWSKVAGMKELNMAKGDAKMKVMNSTKDAVGLTFNSVNSSSAVSYYTGSGSGPINEGLRETGYAALGPSTKGHINKLDNLMELTKEDAIMWRGMGTHGNDIKNMNNIPPPSEFIDLGFASMSHNPSISKNFAGESIVHGTGKTTLFRVRVPKGTKAAFISRRADEAWAMRDEAEVIAARGTRFKYISTSRNVKIGDYNETVDVIEVEIVTDKGGNI